MMLSHAEAPIKAFLADFQSGQLNGLEETDLHKNLFSRLYGQFHTLGIRFTAPKAAMGIQYYVEQPEISINPVRTHYPTTEKFDVVILDTTQAPQATPDYPAIWQQPLAFALNLRLCIDPTFLARYLKHAQSDLQKFAQFRQTNGSDHLVAAVSLILCTTDIDAAPDGFEQKIAEPQSGSAIWLVTPSALWSAQD